MLKIPIYRDFQRRFCGFELFSTAKTARKAHFIGVCACIPHAKFKVKFTALHR